MALPSTSAPNKGFTLLEVLISIGLLALIAGLSLFISIDFYRHFSLRSERSTVVTVLQKARSQSMDNIDGVRHGVHFNNPLKYIIFECPSGTPKCTTYASSSSDLPIDSSYNASLSTPALPFDVIFDQLSGDCVVTTSSTVFNCLITQPITVNDGNKTYNITINSVGRIDWQ